MTLELYWLENRLVCYYWVVNYDHERLIKMATDSVTRLGDLLDFVQFFKPLATINLPKSPTFFGNFSKGVKIYKFSGEIVFGQIL